MNKLLRRGVEALIAGGLFMPGMQAQQVILYTAADLNAVTDAVRSGDKDARVLVEELLKRGDRILRRAPRSVTEKEAVPPSGDKRDYMSMARYWWPDPSKADGLPYIRRDGETNPEIEKIEDHRFLNETVRAVQVLAFSCYFSGKQAYARKAVDFLRTWFLDDSTRMNPNLNYAQSVPGRYPGRSFGIIDTRRLASLVDVIPLIPESEAWRSQEQGRLREWFSDYYEWLRTSELGREEEKALNNHGTWYDVQAASIALYLGKRDDAMEILTRAKELRIGLQIAPDGSQPEELARTVSWDYSLFNLEALFLLASLGERVGVDLWNHESGDGRSLRKALDFLCAVAEGEQEWDYKQIRAIKFDRLCPLLEDAESRYDDHRYQELRERLGCMSGWSERVRWNWKSLIH
ncbi:MAG TPA: alginate lyase family protein [Bacteroidota bacterium]